MWREVVKYDDEYDEPVRRRRRRRRDYDDRVGFRCPFCNTDEMPVWRSKISTGG
jgi:hypothetical protein